MCIHIHFNPKRMMKQSVFGKSIVDKWHVPDHTKIEKFRFRLRSEATTFMTQGADGLQTFGPLFLPHVALRI